MTDKNTENPTGIWLSKTCMYFPPSTLNVVTLQLHRAQLHIRGYGVVQTVGAEIEARKRRKVDMISIDMVIKIKVFHGKQ